MEVAEYLKNHPEIKEILISGGGHLNSESNYREFKELLNHK